MELFPSVFGVPFIAHITTCFFCVVLAGITEAFRRSTFITSSAALAAALGITGECLWLTGVRALATSHPVSSEIASLSYQPVSSYCSE